MIRILFIHPNLPGQFLNICLLLRRLPGVEVFFISNPNSNHIHNICRIDLPPPESGSPIAVLEARGVATANALRELCAAGKRPDLILAHPAWGDTVFLKIVDPSIPLICLPEWYAQTDGGMDRFIMAQAYPIEVKVALLRSFQEHNLAALKAAADADRLVVPTQFQRAQFPRFLQDHLTVLHEGISDDFYALERAAVAPEAMDIGSRQVDGRAGIVTFVTRSLEPLRGYPQFLEAARIVRQRRPKTVFLVAGNEQNGGYLPCPVAGLPWRRYLEQSCPQDDDHYIFLGLLNRQAYQQVLMASTVHVYLTGPYVLSWSLVEAMAAGCAIVASATPPVMEVLEHEKSALLVPFEDAVALADAMERVLDGDAGPIEHMRHNARLAARRYQASRVTPLLAELIADTLGEERSGELRAALRAACTPT